MLDAEMAWPSTLTPKMKSLMSLWKKNKLKEFTVWIFGVTTMLRIIVSRTKLDSSDCLASLDVPYSPNYTVI